VTYELLPLDSEVVTVAEAEVAIRTLLQFLGEDPDRDGLVETPRRVVAAMQELTSGMRQDPLVFLKKQFELSGTGSIVVIRDIEFVSICEHHLLPFQGHCTVGYLPTKDESDKYKVAGLSKFPRVVEAFARRPQLQEQLTAQIANCVQEGLNTQDVMVVIKSIHSCMSIRGVEAKGAETVTAVALGRFDTNEDGMKDEFYRMLML
jgi:GTP cyclohydrolase I